jgi:hypothetical protein
MAVSETVQHAVHGKLIALEGDTEMLATQLRLLPQLKKFLVISSMNEAFTAIETSILAHTCVRFT